MVFSFPPFYVHQNTMRYIRLRKDNWLRSPSDFLKDLNLALFRPSPTLTAIPYWLSLTLSIRYSLPDRLKDPISLEGGRVGPSTR